MESTVAYHCVCLYFNNAIFLKKVKYWSPIPPFFSLRLCRFCVVIRVFHPRPHNGQWPPTSMDFLSQILSITFNFPILILKKTPVFSFFMFCAKQGNYWYHFYNVFGMTRCLAGDWTRDLPHSMPIPLILYCVYVSIMLYTPTRQRTIKDKYCFYVTAAVNGWQLGW